MDDWNLSRSTSHLTEIENKREKDCTSMIVSDRVCILWKLDLDSTLAWPFWWPLSLLLIEHTVLWVSIWASLCLTASHMVRGFVLWLMMRNFSILADCKLERPVQHNDMVLWKISDCQICAKGFWVDHLTRTTLIWSFAGWSEPFWSGVSSAIDICQDGSVCCQWDDAMTLFSSKSNPGIQVNAKLSKALSFCVSVVVVDIWDHFTSFSLHPYCVDVDLP